MRMNKRGISAIVATVMIILITVAAIGILWAAIIPMIQTNLDFSSLQGRVSVLDKGYTAYDSSQNIASVQVKRDVDEGVMDRIKITFEVNGNSYSSSVIAPESGGTKVYTFDMAGIGEPDSVSVAPIFAVGNKEKEGEITSTVEIPKSRVADVEAVVYEIGEEYESEFPMTGLVSWWKFDGDLTDSIGNNDGILSGDANINNEGQLVLDGAADYVRRETLDNAPLGNSARTMMGWINSVSYPDINYNGIVAYGGGSISHGSMLSIKNNGRLSMAFWSNDAHQSIDPVISLNEWSHAAFSYDGGTSIKFYINGVFVQELSVGVPADTTNGLLRIGCTDAGGSRCVNGKLDDVMIYNRALSEEEVKIIHDFQKKN